MSFFFFSCDQREEADFARKADCEYERAAEQLQSQEERRHEETMQYQRELEQQLLDKERKKQQAYEELLREKLTVDEIVRKIYEEDQM